MLGGAVTGKLAEARSTGVFALDPRAVKALVDETNTASSTFGEIVTAMLAKNPSARIAAQDVERALATGASVVAGGAAIVEEDEEEEEDEAIAAATEQRRAAEVKAAEERRQRLAAEAKTAEAERKLRAAEATAAEEKKQRKAAAAAEAERRRRAAATAKAAEEKRRREAEDVDLSKLVELRTLQGHSSYVRRAASALCTAFVNWVFVVGQWRCGVSGRAARRVWVVGQHAQGVGRGGG